MGNKVPIIRTHCLDCLLQLAWSEAQQFSPVLDRHGISQIDLIAQARGIGSFIQFHDFHFH